MIKCFIAVRKFFYKIKLVDRCLILFMAILMMQSTYSLFTNELNLQETSAIDIMVRTTSAAIFGYFLSVNFIKKPARKSGGEILTRTVTVPGKRTPDAPSGQIGFQAASAEEGEALNCGAARQVVEELQEETENGQQQIIIATIIGAFALCVLIFVRNFSTISPAMLSTIAQMRDFVSGCVGFLLGCPGTEPA